MLLNTFCCLKIIIIIIIIMYYDNYYYKLCTPIFQYNYIQFDNVCCVNAHLYHGPCTLQLAFPFLYNKLADLYRQQDYNNNNNYNNNIIIIII